MNDQISPSPAQLARLTALLDALGRVPMASEEYSSLLWLAGQEAPTVNRLAAVIRRARAADHVQPATPPETWEHQVTTAIREVFDRQVATWITEDEAFGALLHRLRGECQATGESPTDALRALPDDERDFCAIAYQPAAFLASRIERSQR